MNDEGIRNNLISLNSVCRLYIFLHAFDTLDATKVYASATRAEARASEIIADAKTITGISSPHLNQND